MLKFLFCIAILAATYFVAIGFLKTADRMGWDEHANAPSKHQTAKR